MKNDSMDDRGIGVRMVPGERLLQDVRFALRSFTRRPGWVLIAVLSLGLGIGVNATIFDWLKAVYFNPLPGVRDARSLVTINAAYRDADGYSNSYPDFLYIRDHSNLFGGLFAHEMEIAALSDGRLAEMTVGGIVSGDYFEVLGARTVMGRVFRPEEDEVADRNPVIVLGYSLWQRRFAGDAAIVGRQVELNRTPFTVIGVATPGFLGVYGGIRQDFWVPLHMARAFDPERQDRLMRGSWLQIMGRPKAGVSLAAIQANLDVLSAQMRASHHKSDPDYRAQVYALHRAQRGFHSSLFEMVRVLAMAVGIVLLLACLNVANLLIARASDRSREISIRLSLGASRGRIVRQLFTESLLLAAMGGAIGLWIAFWSRSLPGLLSGGDIVLYLNTDIDWTVMAFLFAVSVAAATVFGLLPALETVRVNLVDALKEGAGSLTSSRRRNLWRSSLVVGQVALSMAALVGAALFAQYLLRLVKADRGFRSENLLTAETDLFAGGLDESRGRIFYRAAIERLSAMPQVESAAWTTFLPMSGSGGGNRRAAEVQGYAPPDAKPLSVVVDAVSPGFLRTLGIPLVRGREFEWTDDSTAAPVLMVNEKFVDEYLKGRDPIGVAVRIGKDWRTIAGVHRNYVYRHPSSPVRPTVFLPLAQDYDAHAIIVVRAKTDPWLMAGPLRQMIRDFDHNLPVTRVVTMEQNVAQQFVETKIATGTLLIFGIIASTLAAIGLYGVLATFVNQRRREFGVRTALGATAGELRRLVLFRSVRLTLIGLAIGLMLSMAFAQLLQSSLEGAGGFSLFIYAIAVLGIAIIAGVSTYIPARSASRLDPMTALRYE